MFEAYALRRFDQSLHEEDWPLLELKDATVTHLHRRELAGKLVDLFEVNLHGPFRVKGRLGKLKKEQESLVLSTRIYSEELVIAKVYTYSLEMKADGKIIIWVLGNAGWYALSPAKEYKSIFEGMMEKTRLWFFLEDVYPSVTLRGKYKKIKGTVDQIYAEFSRDNPEWPTPNAAKALFHKYHEFLILKMIVKEEEGFDWSRTPIYTEIFTKYIDAAEEIRRILRRRTPQASAANSEAEPALPKTAENTIQVKPTTSPTTTSQSSSIMIANPISVPKKVHQRSRSSTLFQFLEKFLSEDEVNPKEITLDRLADYAYSRLEVKDKQMAMDVILARGLDLELLMRGSTGYSWKDTPVFSKLGTNISGANRVARHSAALALVIRERLVPVGTKAQGRTAGTLSKASSIPDSLDEPASLAAAEEEEADEEEESESETEENAQPRSSKGKSVLRPRSSVIPVEAPRPLADGAPESDWDEEMENLDPLDDEDNTSATTSKRGADEESNPAERLSKRIRSLQAQSSPSPSILPDVKIEWPKLVPGTGKPPIKVGKVPPTSSNRPGGIWICSLPGCRHKIFKADTTAGMKLVEEHYQFHASKMQDAMDIVAKETERARGIYHVDNLLAKIEEMAKIWAEHRPSSAGAPS